MPRSARSMRHDLVEQGDGDAAMRDTLPTLKFRAEPEMRDDTVTAAFEMHVQTDGVLGTASETSSVVDGHPAQRPEPKRMAR